MNKATSKEKFVFLETTVQIDRVIGDQERRNTIRRNINSRHLITSGHVLAEYNKTLVKDAITFRDLLRSSPDVGEAVKRLRKYVPVGRKFDRTVLLLSSLGWDKDKQNTIDRLEKFIEWQAHDYFWESIDKSLYIDNIKCALQFLKVVQGEIGQYDVEVIKCLKSNPPQCFITTFIDENKTLLLAFSSNAKDHSRENVAKSAQTFISIFDEQTTPFGQRNCYIISDTLIVLEAPSDSEIYNTDGDVHAICKILGKPIFSEMPIDA